MITKTSDASSVSFFQFFAGSAIAVVSAWVSISLITSVGGTFRFIGL